MPETTFGDVVKFAIEQEQAAAELYERTAERAEARPAKMLLEEMGAMERSHEARLKALLATGMASFPTPGDTRDIHVSDYLVADPLAPDSPLDKVYVFAMKAEQKARELYLRMAAVVSEGPSRELLETLAEEELRHKQDLEMQYERGFMKDN